MNRVWLLAILWGNASVLTAAERAAPPTAQTPATSSMARITPEDLAARIERADSGIVVLDVRSAEEFAAGHVPGALNVPHDQVPQRIGELASFKDKEIVLYCRSGRRSQRAAQVLRDQGFTRLWQLDGDYPGWAASQKSD